MPEGKTNLRVVVAVLAVVLIAFTAYEATRLWAQNRIREVESELNSVRNERDSVVLVATIRDSLKGEFGKQIDSVLDVTHALRATIDSIEDERAARQLEVRELRTSDAVAQEFREEFPAFAPATRITEDRRGPLPMLYLSVPVDFAESFIIHKRNSDAYHEQVDSLRLLDSLNVEVVALKDSVIHLTELNERMFRVGYNSMYTRYEERTAEYIDLLGQPRLSFNVPTVAVVLASLGTGLLIGTAVGN